MKARSIIVAACLVSSSFIAAQDPSFRLPEARTTTQASAPIVPSGDVKASVSNINDMDVVDNTRPIRPGDLISLRIVEDRKEPTQLRVGVTGDINAPHIGLVRAAGRTSRELAYFMKSQLERSLYNKATVLVAIDQTIEDVRGTGRGYGIGYEDMEVVTIFGQVIRQGKYELPVSEDMTISQAILMAGGFAQFANPKNVRLIRKTPQGSKNILINVDSIMRRGQLDKDVFLRKGDVIIVKEKNVNI